MAACPLSARVAHLPWRARAAILIRTPSRIPQPLTAEPDLAFATGAPVDGDTAPKAVRVVVPACPRGGLVVASPHSGRYYPPEFVANSRLDAFTLRRSEDAFVDHLLRDAPDLGATLVTTDFARAYIDMNRAPDELDPVLIDGLSAREAAAPSARVQAGLGVVPRSVGDGAMIYAGKIPASAARERVRALHGPYHRELAAHLDAMARRFGRAVLLDCHSMPASAAGQGQPDVVLGDRFGAACAPVFTQAAQSALRAQGLKVARNSPYAGGYVTELHGRPGTGRHALQIEINRSLYIVEGSLRLRDSFDAVRHAMAALVTALVEAAEALA